MAKPPDLRAATLRERVLLPRYLSDDESVLVMQPAFNRNVGLLAATEVRLLFVSRGLLRPRCRVLSLPYYYLRGSVTVDPDPVGGVALTANLAGKEIAFGQLGEEGAKTLQLVIGQFRPRAPLDSRLPLGEDQLSKRLRVGWWVAATVAFIAVAEWFGYRDYAVSLAVGFALSSLIWGRKPQR